jgi:hypothetical protein
VDPEPLTSGELTRVLAEQYGARPPRGRVPPAVVEAALRVPAVKSRFGDTPKESIAYLNHPVEFDTRRTVDLLGGRGLIPPKFTDYAEAMVRYFREHETDR